LVTLGPGALQFVVDYREVLGAQIPVVYANVGMGFAESLLLPPDVPGIVTEYNWTETLQLAQHLQPSADNLVIISGAGPYDIPYLENLRRQIGAQLQAYNVRYLTGLTDDEVLAEVPSIPANSIVLFNSFFADRNGQTYIPPDVVAKIAQRSKAPIYSTLTQSFGRGIVGGYMDSFDIHGEATADIAISLLTGTDIATIPLQTKPPHRYRVDARELID
jgi:hypothetical protein